MAYVLSVYGARFDIRIYLGANVFLQKFSETFKDK